MFDTIRMKATVHIDTEVFAKYNVEPRHRLFKNTGEIRSTYQMKDEQIHFIRYSESGQLLVIELSIPKFLFGHNVDTVSEGDIPQFWERLYQRIHHLFEVNIDKSLWKIERLDVCLNFNVGDLVGEYIGQIAKKHVPYCKQYLIGNNETIEFKTRKQKRVVTCYNKQLECVAKGEPPEVVEKSRGILRIEVSSSRHELSAYSPDRRATDFLTNHFFEHVIEKPKVKSLLDFSDAVDLPGLDLGWLRTQKILKVETMLGFQLLLDRFGESGLKPLYNPQTLANRKRLLETLGVPSVKCLADLNINNIAL